MTPNSREVPYPMTYTRNILIMVLDAGLKAKTYRFTRQAAISWLNQYPGDLDVNLRLARVLFLEGKPSQAISILEKLCDVDPEFLDAQEGLALAYSSSISSQYVNALSRVNVLGGSIPEGVILPNWSDLLQKARLALLVSNTTGADELIRQVLGLKTNNLLADLLHLQLVIKNQDPTIVLPLASLYHERWPECLQFTLILADIKSGMGDEAGAVSLLHQCLTQDLAGQVPKRLWGQNHRYLPLWPESMNINLDMPLPSEIAYCLEWNSLPASTTQVLENIEKPGINPPVVAELPDNVTNLSVLEQTDERDITQSQTQDEEILGKLSKETIQAKDPNVRSVEIVFERLAKSLRQPSISRSDGRFPMYVIFSSKKALINKYGIQTAGIIDEDLKKLAVVVRKRQGWGSLIFYPDSSECMAGYGLDTVLLNDPWKLKLALVDLDKALAKRGAMIGALLIVGGPDVVPFHRLPNPTDDMDGEVMSDNPYATLDSNYFIPEWPIGRLPGEIGSDPGLLLGQIRQSVSYHTDKNIEVPWWVRIFETIPLFNLFIQKPGKKRFKSKTLLDTSFGYTAAIWRRSSIAVYRPLGDADTLQVSPPTKAQSLNSEKMLQSSLVYYNLHGISDGCDWYGQRDFAEKSDGVEYPVALSPVNLKKNGYVPNIVFSEACFGGHIEKKKIDEAISLKFISIGTLAVIGSTCTAYGSVASPLIGADLLGFLFWKRLREGFDIGDSLVYAKVELAKEMIRRQGYLDGEDQKTLLSFVLYGDPLTAGNKKRTWAKNALRVKSQPIMKTVRDQAAAEEEYSVHHLSSKTILEVKKAVEAYLPGLADAEIHFKKQVEFDTVKGLNGYEYAVKQRKGEMTKNIVVTFSKSLRVARKEHHHFARVTLNDQGKMVKMVVSR